MEDKSLTRSESYPIRILPVLIFLLIVAVPAVAQITTGDDLGNR
jgi:hypothetical protein